MRWKFLITRVDIDGVSVGGTNSIATIQEVLDTDHDDADIVVFDAVNDIVYSNGGESDDTPGWGAEDGGADG